MAKTVTKRQNRFVAALVLEGRTPPQAAVAAGYSESNAAQAAARLMHNKLVLDAIDALRKDQAAKNGISEEYILARLKGIVESESSKTPEIIKALELLGKTMGLWDAKPKNEQTIEIRIADETEGWSV